MKKFSFDHLRLSLSNSFKEQTRYFQNTNAIFENPKIPFNFQKLIVDSTRTGASSTTEIVTKNDLTNSTVQQSRKYSFFSNKYRKFPIKCKIRTNECGEQVAEPYIAKKPSSITIPPLSMDFTMNSDDPCIKLQEKIVNFSPSPPQCTRSMSQKCPKTKLFCPNALTKYLKTKKKCQEVYRGAETNVCEKENSCDSVKKNTYTGKDCAREDPCKPKSSNVTEPHKKQKSKKILETLISKLKSKKLIKPSGFFNEDLAKEVCNRLGIKTASTEFMTRVENTSNREKSPEIKFEVQNLCEYYSSGDNLVEELDANEPYEAVKAFLVQRNHLLEILKKEEADLRSNLLGGMIRSAKSYNIDHPTEKDPEHQENNGIKSKNTQKKVQDKPKNYSVSRRRYTKSRWFNRIPIEPNVKGSVIFANGTAQQLDDPYKILSVNFSDSNVHPMEEKIEVNFDENQRKSAVQHMMDKYDYLVDELTSKSFLNKLESSTKDEESKVDSCIQQRANHKQKDSKLQHKKSNDTQETEETFQRRVEPMSRQKKISKLDNTVKCVTTTELQEKQPQPKKRQMRTKKHSKSDLKQGSTDNLNTPLLDLNNYPTSVSSEAFGKGYHAFTTNNLLVNFKKGSGNHEEKRGNDVGGAKSDSSFVKIKEISPMLESGDEKDVPRGKLDLSKNCPKRDILLLPGLARPVTQKTACLNLLESNVVRPVSRPWKKTSAYPGKITDKGDKKNALSITKKPETIDIKGVNHQQYRMKSTQKVAPSKCDVEKKPCINRKKNHDGEADGSFPIDWDYDAKVPDEIARKWYTWDCSKEKDGPCPITNDDLKKGLPKMKRPSAAAINRCNLEECKHRLRCRRTVTKCRNTECTNRPDK